MIKRSANKQGVITFNINFHGLKSGNNSCKAESSNNTPLPPNEALHHSLFTSSNPQTPIGIDSANKFHRCDTTSMSPGLDYFDMEDIHTPEENYARGVTNYTEGGENYLKASSDEFMTQEPIDFDGTSLYPINPP